LESLLKIIALAAGMHVVELYPERACRCLLVFANLAELRPGVRKPGRVEIAGASVVFRLR
jgi:hypothetical protein